MLEFIHDDLKLDRRLVPSALSRFHILNPIDVILLKIIVPDFISTRLQMKTLEKLCSVNSLEHYFRSNQNQGPLPSRSLTSSSSK